jgi:hypothetical protein
MKPLPADQGLQHNDALRRLASRLVGILHGCLKTRTCYDEATAWDHRENTGQTPAAAWHPNSWDVFHEASVSSYGKVESSSGPAAVRRTCCSSLTPCPPTGSPM